MALRGSLLLALVLVLLFSTSPCSATTTCPSIYIKPKAQALSSAFSPYPVNLTCSCKPNLVGRGIRFTAPLSASMYTITFETAEAGAYAAIEVRQAPECSSDNYTVVACVSRTANSLGWVDLTLIPNQHYIIVVFTNTTSSLQMPDKLLIAKSCTSLSFDPGTVYNSTTRAVNMTLSSASAVVDKSPCGIKTKTNSSQTMHLVQFSPPVTGWYSLLVRNFDGGRDIVDGRTAFQGFLEILQGDCISIATAPSSSSSSLFCKSSLNTLGKESIFLQQAQTYTIRVGNLPNSQYPEFVHMPDNKNVLEARYVSAAGGGPDSTCLDYKIPSKSTYQTYELSSLNVVNTILHCGRRYHHTPTLTSARYVAYTPLTTGDHYVRAFERSPHWAPPYTVEIRANNCQGSNVSCSSADWWSFVNPYVGFNSVLMFSNTTYVIMVGYEDARFFPSWYKKSVMVEVGLVSTYRGESPEDCTDNGLISTPHYQTAVLLSRYWLSEPMSCVSTDKHSGLYVSFRAPFTGNYFAWVRNPTITLGVEVRSGRCMGASVGCSTARSASQVAATGLDRVYMETGQWYVIRVNPRSYGDVVAGNTLELGYCGNMCAYTDGHNSDGDQDVNAATKTFGSVANVIQYNLATVVTPAVFFLVALVLGLRFCLKDRAAVHAVDRVEGGVPMAVPHGAASLLIPLHRQCFACAVLAVGVWVSGWAVFWSVMAYPLSVLVCVRALFIARSATTERRFVNDASFRDASMLLLSFVGSGMLLLGNAVVALVQAVQQMTDGLAFCYKYYAGSQACITSLTLNPVYGVLAAVAMVALGVYSIRLGYVVHNTVEARRLVIMRRAFGGQVPEAEVVRGPHSNQPQPDHPQLTQPQVQPATVVTFRTHQQQPQQQQQQQQHARDTVLAEEVADVHEDALCQICSNARTSRTFYKCGHRTCAACADKIMRTTHKRCPFCNQPIKDVIAYLANCKPLQLLL